MPRTLRLRQFVDESAVSPKSVDVGSGEALCDLDRSTVGVPVPVPVPMPMPMPVPRG